MTASHFDEIVHAPQRLRILAMIDAVAGDLEFAVLRDALDVADSVLSKHLKVLSEAGYVTVRKVATIGRPRTWIGLTALGAEAYRAHVAALRELFANGAAALEP